MSEEHIGRMKEPEIVGLSQKPISLIPKAAFWWVSIPIFLYALYSVTNGYIEKYRNKAEKVTAPEKARGRALGGTEMFFLVTADSPACVTIPARDSILAAVGKGGNLKVFYPDGEVMRIGPNQRAPVRSFEAGSRICLLLDDGEKQPVKMRLRS